MASKKRKYNLKRIRLNYTYSVEEVAELLGVSDITVFRWIADEGLSRLPQSRKYYVHGSVLRTFLSYKNEKNKKPCHDDQIYCCKCRKPQSPDSQTIKPQTLPNRTVRVSGKCEVCGTPINKVISAGKWDKNHPLYPNINADKKQHNGERKAQHKCEDRKEGQLCLNLTL